MLVGSFSRLWNAGDDVPAVVIVAVNVEHFLALDTKDTAWRLGIFTINSLEHKYPESTHSVNPVQHQHQPVLPRWWDGGVCYVTCSKDDNIVFGRDFFHDCGLLVGI